VSFSDKNQIIATQKFSREVEELQTELHTVQEENKQLQELAQETEGLLQSKDQLNNELNLHIDQLNEDFMKLQESHDLLTKTSQGLDKIILETTTKLQKEMHDNEILRSETETLKAELNTHQEMEKLTNKQLEDLLAVELKQRGVLIDKQRKSTNVAPIVEALKKENDLLKSEMLKVKVQLDEKEHKIKEQEKQVEEQIRSSQVNESLIQQQLDKKKILDKKKLDEIRHKRQQENKLRDSYEASSEPDSDDNLYSFGRSIRERKILDKKQMISDHPVTLQTALNTIDVRQLILLLIVVPVLLIVILYVVLK